MFLKNLITSLFGLLSLITTLTVFASPIPFFAGNADNLELEIGLARQQNKKGILIFYSTPHCPFCKRMKERVLNQPEVAQLFQSHFHLLEMNILEERPIKDFSGKLTTAKQFAQESHIRVTPTLIFYDTTGELLFKQVGIIADPKAFRWLGEYILEAGYQRESFQHYLRKKRHRH